MGIDVQERGPGLLYGMHPTLTWTKNFG